MHHCKGYGLASVEIAVNEVSSLEFSVSKAVILFWLVPQRSVIVLFEACYFSGEATLARFGRRW